MRRSISTQLPFGLLILTSALWAQEAIDGKAAMKTLNTLTSPEFEGRKSGLPGGDRAEEWMAKRIEEAGLKPLPDGSYFHSFKASVTIAGDKPEFAIDGGATAAYLEDYVTLLYSGAAQVDAPVVLAGWGIHAPDKGYSDYEGLDVKGKIVMAVRGKPDDARFDVERYIGYKSSTAFERGAVGFILVEGDKAVPGTIQEKYYRKSLPAIWAARPFADKLLQQGASTDLKGIVEALKRGERVSYPLKGVRCKLRITARLLKDRRMRNVCGVWRGAGDSKEWIVVGAHLDHVGVDALGNLYPGADDNASGSSMLLEVARAVARGGEHFRRNILFVWFAGEEQGLLGSWQFVRRPPVPLDRIAVMINTDMVGQGEPRLSVAGGDVYPRDAAWLSDLGVGKIEWKPSRSGNRSDHYPFQASGVPAFFVSTQGKHPNYHQPGDIAANIKVELLELAATYIWRLGVRAAKSEQPHVRPRRLDEYRWHRATTFDARSAKAPPATAGIDARIDWHDGTWSDMERTLARARADAVAKGARQNAILPGSAPGPALRALAPTSLLGVKGGDGVRFARAAHEEGALCFAPFVGERPLENPADLRLLNELCADHPIIVDLWGATGTTLPPESLAALDRPILLVPADRLPVWRKVLQRRRAPWIVIYPLRPLTENKQHVRVEVAAAFQRWIEAARLPPARVVIVSGPAEDETWAAQAPTYMPGLLAALESAGYDERTVRGLLGGNFLNLLSRTLKPAPRGS